MAKKKIKRTNEASNNVKSVQVNNELIEEIYDISDLDELDNNNSNDSEEYFDTSDLDDDFDDEPYETFDYNFRREDEDTTSLPELHIEELSQQQNVISFDYIKLKFSLTNADEASFRVPDPDKFLRSSKPEIPATKNETYAGFHYLEKPFHTMALSEYELRKIETQEVQKAPFRLAKLRFPNAKPFFNGDNHRLGLGHMYFKNGEFIVVMTGKIVSNAGMLGLINRNNIEQALNEIKSTGLVDFDNAVFIDKAEVLAVHITTDITTPCINEHLQAFSSFLPIRTDKYNVLKFGNFGYEILSRSRKSRAVPIYEFCIYNKGKEVRSNRKGRFNKNTYSKRIAPTGMALADNTLRLELRLLNFPAIRKFLAPTKEDGTITLRELLECEQTPIRAMFQDLNITSDSLKEARGKYITILKEDKRPTQAEFERMFGLIKLLELHNYSLDKVRSYIETETGRKTSSNYFKEKRDILQRYLACYMPQTVARMSELLEIVSY